LHLLLHEVGKRLLPFVGLLLHEVSLLLKLVRHLLLELICQVLLPLLGSLLVCSHLLSGLLKLLLHGHRGCRRHLVLAGLFRLTFARPSACHLP